LQRLRVASSRNLWRAKGKGGAGALGMVQTGPVADDDGVSEKATRILQDCRVSAMTPSYHTLECANNQTLARSHIVCPRRAPAESF